MTKNFLFFIFGLFLAISNYSLSAQSDTCIPPTVVVSPSYPQRCVSDPATQLTAFGATIYSWSPATGLSNPYVSNPMANPMETTTYTVTGTNANGCTGTANVTVTVIPPPAIPGNPTGPSEVCRSSMPVRYSVPFQFGVNFIWSVSPAVPTIAYASPGGNQVDVYWNNAPAGTYTLSVIATTSGCNSPVRNYSVLVKDVPTQPFNINGNSYFCLESGAGINSAYTVSLPKPNTIYIWKLTPASSGTFLNANGTENMIIRWNTIGNHTLSVTASNSCGNGTVQTRTVMITPKPTVSITSNPGLTICQGSNTILTASGAQTYVWSPATGLNSTTIANPRANPGVTTTYTVTGTDGYQCTNTAQVTVTVIAKPIVYTTTPTVTLCEGTNYPITAYGTPGVTYVWSNGYTSAQTIVNSAGTYTVTGTDAYGCSNTAQAIVTILPKPTVSIISNPGLTICRNANGGIIPITLSAVTSSGNGISTSWMKEGGAVFSGSPSISVSDQGTYILTASNGSCTNTAQVTVVMAPLPTINTVEIKSAYCGLANGSIKVKAQLPGITPTPLFEYSLNGINWFMNNTFTNLYAGTYTVRARVIGNTCYGIGMAIVTIPLNIPPPQIYQVYRESTKAILTWNPIGDAMTNYSVRYKRTSDPFWTNLLPVTGTNLYLGYNNKDILLPSTQYEVQVKVVCPNGSSTDWSSSFVFRTKALREENFDINSDNEPIIYPNPNKGTFVLTGVEANSEITLFDMTGREIWKGNYSGEELRLESISNSIYSLKVKDRYLKMIIE